MDILNAIVEYFKFVVIGVAGGFTVAIYLDVGTSTNLKLPLIFIWLAIFLILYLIFSKVHEMKRK